MNKFLYSIYPVILAVFLFVSCGKEARVQLDEGSSLTPDGRVLLSFSAQAPVPDRVQAKASSTQEDQISNVYVLIFDQTHRLSQAPSEAVSDGTKYKVALAPNPAVQNIYVVTNLSASHKATLGGLSVGSSTYDDVRVLLVTDPVEASGVPTPFPMCSHVIQSAISPSMGGKTAILERMVARMDVDASSVNTATFALKSVTLLNAAAKGFILSGSERTPFSGAGEVVRYGEEAAAGNRVTSAIYCYENAGVLQDQTTANPTRLLIKGKYKNGAFGYYLLHVVYKQVTDPNGTKRYDINRNVIYTIHVTGVDSPGYLTEAEALANKPTNDIEYHVTVTDPNAHDLVSNGDYYLGFSNSDCLIFSSEEANNLTVAILTHNAPASVTSRDFSVSGADLSLVSNPLLVNADTPSPVVVNIGRNFSSGMITFRLGNLEKTLQIERRENSLSFGGVLPLGPDYVLGEILHTDPLAENWLKFSEDISGTLAGGADRIVSAIGEEVFVVFDHNITTLDGPSRDKYEEAYLSRGHESGRTKAIFYQHSYNMIKLDGKPIGNAVVATFHRHNQVGERIVKIANPLTDGLWIVEVVAGKDFIKIAPGMNPNPDPNLFTATFNDAENYPVEGSLTQIVGTANEIAFRVGMKGTIDSTQNRYGLILVTHATGSNRIFVRQGEAADYIMQESDPIRLPASVTSPNRPDAVMFSPFNLTDPQGRTGRVDLSLNGGEGGFTTYPSQAGYLFQAFKPYAWYPLGRNPTNWDTGLNVVAKWEVCPPGYRRPKDGADGSSGNVIGSEIRQSLWYNPRNANWSSDYENIIRGYLADGFFDRQQVQTPVAGDLYGAFQTTSFPSVVGSGAQVAMAGQVIFNPRTFASIFIPATGTRSYYGGGTLTNVGVDASLWTGTNTGGATWAASMIFWGGKFTFDNENTTNSSGFTIRCVKKRVGEP